MPAISACQRCHTKKIKCDGIRPTCHPCIEAGTQCTPHVRQRRGFDKGTQDSLRLRVAWLEKCLSDRLGIEAATLKTGSDLGVSANLLKRPRSSGNGQSEIDTSRSIADVERPPVDQASSLPRDSGSDEVAINVPPDVSLLTLNASGEMRYLGPSSGSFFAQYALAFARTVVSSKAPLSSQQHDKQPSLSRTEASNFSRTIQVESALNNRICQYLQGLYFKWVHVVWPLLDDDFRASVLDPLHDSHQRQKFASGNYLQRICLSIYYLVLALGAVHVDSHVSEDNWNTFQEYQKLNSDRALSPDSLFVKAIEILEHISHSLSPSISFIRILVLICIYGSFKPSGNRQWQLAGIAIRTAIEIGLHRHRGNWNFNKNELDIRRRVFWVAYAIELTVSFNLGRPPSIPEEHIDAEFPTETAEIVLGLHHIRHRRIQSKILSEIYCGQQKLADTDPGCRSEIVSKSQQSLDRWKLKLHEIYLLSNTSYPLEYWERLYHATTVAIHRPNPLLPIQSTASANRCIRSAGNYIDAHHDLFKSRGVPQSWMLLQGMVLAGLTVLVTARINKSLFPDQMECSLVEIMEWNRKCSVVLNIMGERWSDQTISDVESKFSQLANDTLKQLTRPISTSPKTSTHYKDHTNVSGNFSDFRTPAADQSLSDTDLDASLPQQNSFWPSGYSSGAQNIWQQPGLQDSIPDADSAYLNDLSFVDSFPLETFLGMDDTSLWIQDDMSIDWLRTS